MQLVFVKTCYVNIDSRCSKNREKQHANTFKMDKMLDLKTLKNTYLAWIQGLTNLLRAFMMYKNREKKQKVMACLCKNPDFCLYVKFMKK